MFSRGGFSPCRAPSGAASRRPWSEPGGRRSARRVRRRRNTGLGLAPRPPRPAAGPVGLVGSRRRCHLERRASPPAIATRRPPRGLRLERPELIDEAPDRVLIAPLRGWRRALGTLVIEGAPGAPRPRRRAAPRARARARTRSCRSASRTSQLLDEMLCGSGACSRTPSTRSSISSPSRTTTLRIVQTNEAFAARVGHAARRACIDRPLERARRRGHRGLGGRGGRRRPVVPAVQRRVRTISTSGSTARFAVTATPLINAGRRDRRDACSSRATSRGRRGSRRSAPRCASGWRSRRSWRRSASSSPASRTR